MFSSLVRGSNSNAWRLLSSQAIKAPIYITQCPSNPFRTFCSDQSTATTSNEADENQETVENRYQSKVGVFTHPSCQWHDVPDHPECPERLKAVMECMNNPEIKENLHLFDKPTQITRSRITMAHSQIHVDDILERARDAAEENKMIPLDGDTVLSPHSAQSIMYAPAAVCYAVDIVLNDDEDYEFKDIHRAFCAVRPPGHHAEYDRSMGFCIFNNIFIGAKYAQYLFGTLFDKHTAKIAIVDIDVHHGNGTQAMAWNEQNICYISMHQYDPEGRFYPGTGAANECGAFDNVLNIPLYPGSNGQDAHNQWTEKVIQKLDAFEPDLVMISAGFDAHQEDQLASLQFTADDYQWMTQDMVRVANEHCSGKIISVLEGGYNLEALKECSTVHIKELCV